MNDLLNQFAIDSGETFSLVNYLINIVLCAILLYLLSLVYVRFGRSLSNRTQLSKVLIVVGVTTFIIISIVKSSLALSLGLVGALSIIRFRTAIKEPEELGYFFIAIAIGLGFGANQVVPTVVGAFVLFLIIFLAGKSASKNMINQNILISKVSADEEDRTELQKSIMSILAQNSSRTELIRMNVDKNQMSYNFLIVLKDLNSINEITKDLTKMDNQLSITFIDSQNMTI
ncbi:DUF4956 domain-containing protein [Pareuzebyella sediminis]|uniref:DUF4956 domain-containing protein n=1 Tax=Pareuzebyella sediminis TaxID=2607998 RepID=UPI0011EED7EB|nr:DUF4956 domain-containing protein [Pareuzebyella sediminis]